MIMGKKRPIGQLNSSINSTPSHGSHGTSLTALFSILPDDSIRSFNILPIIASMTLCRCLQRYQVPPKDQSDLEHLDLLSASRYLRKVGLKVSDVRMKLGLNRIIHFLAETATKEDHGYSFIQHVEREEEGSKVGARGRMDPGRGNKENLTDLNEPESFVAIETSHSFLSQLHPNGEYYFPPPVAIPPPSSLSKAFLVKQVVTKNTLQDEPPRHVRFVSSIKSQMEEDRDEIVEKLEEQNRTLQSCLKNIFTFFEEKQLLRLDGELKRSQLDGVAEQLTSNFIDYTHDIQERMNNLSAKSSLLQDTLHNMSISLRIEREQQPLSKAVQTDQRDQRQEEEEEEGEEEESEARVELAAAESAAKRAELVLYLKEEEIASLRVIVADLQNKLKFYKSQEKPRSRSYKKFFEVTGEDLSQSTR